MAHVTALALDAYNRMTLGGHDRESLADMYSAASGFVEWRGLKGGERRMALAAFTRPQINRAIHLAERWIDEPESMLNEADEDVDDS